MFNAKLKHKSQNTRKPISPPKQKYEMTKDRFLEIKDAPIPCLIHPHYDTEGTNVRCRFTYNGERYKHKIGYKKIGYEKAQQQLVDWFNGELNKLQAKFTAPTESTNDNGNEVEMHDEMDTDTESVCSNMSVEMIVCQVKMMTTWTMMIHQSRLTKILINMKLCCDCSIGVCFIYSKIGVCFIGVYFNGF